jgi:hypothetical protein
MMCGQQANYQILASPAAMQIRQLEALQNMARTSGSKTIFGKQPHRTIEQES